MKANLNTGGKYSIAIFGKFSIAIDKHAKSDFPDCVGLLL